MIRCYITNIHIDGDSMVATKTIKIEIKVKDDKKVPVSRAIEIFRKIQEVVYNVGDHIRGNPPRMGGDFPEIVKKECELLFKELKSGSLIAELQIGDEQTSLPNMQTYGEMALNNTNEIIEAINIEAKPEDALNKIVNNPLRLYRILEDLEPIWPEPSSDYIVSFGYDHKPRNFIPERKQIIKELLHPPTKTREEVITGRIYDIRVDQQKRILIDTIDGSKNVTYPAELESYVFDHVGKLVEIHGEAILEGKKIIGYKLQDKNDLSKKKSLDISIIKMRDRIIHLKEPIPVEIEFEEKQYILSYEKLNLLAVAPKIKDGLDEINSELATIWNEYALVDNSELSEDAIKLKNYLLSLVQEGRQPDSI